MITLVDSHCHLDFPDFAADLNAIVERAAEAHIARIVSICTRVRQFDKPLAIAERASQIRTRLTPARRLEDLDYVQCPCIVCVYVDTT